MTRRKEPFDEEGESLVLTFGRQIGDAMKEQGHTTRTLGKAVGLKQNSVSRIISGEQVASPPQLLKFSRVLGIKFEIEAEGNGTTPDGQHVQADAPAPQRG